MPYRIEWIKRWSSRSPAHNWTMTKVRASVTEAGYAVQNDGTQIDYVILDGSDEQVIRDRQRITQVLKRHSSKLPIRFFPTYKN